MVNSDCNYRNRSCMPEKNTYPNWAVKAEKKTRVTKSVFKSSKGYPSHCKGKKNPVGYSEKWEPRNVIFSFATWGIMNRNSRSGHTYCSVYYQSHKVLCGQNEGWWLEHVNWDKEGTCLRGDTVSSRKPLSVLPASTWSVKRFQPHQGTSRSDEADLELSQTPFPHLVGKKNWHMQTPRFLLERIHGSEQKWPHSTRARSKLLKSLFCRTVVLVYSN